TITNHILTECPVVVNKKFWGALTPEQQKIFREAAEVQIEVNREGNTKLRADTVEKARAQKVEVYVLTAQDRAVFKKALKPVYDKYREVFGAVWYDYFLKKIDYYSK
ncbi:MAG: C4-dicarboxylate ABC transporter substrate-binding protein, partial [Thermodesulfobacteriota bacterium]